MKSDINRSNWTPCHHRLWVYGILVILFPLPLVISRGVAFVNRDVSDEIPSTLPTTLDFEGTTPGDYVLSFDTSPITAQEGQDENVELMPDESAERTTVTHPAYPSVHIKTGRHFGSRTTNSSTTKQPAENTVHPALKTRPTVPVITFIPTTFNSRILRRRFNGTEAPTTTTASPEISTEEEIPTTTSQPPSLIQRRKLLYGARPLRPVQTTTDPPTTEHVNSDETEPTTVPPTTSRPRKIKIGVPHIRVPPRIVVPNSSEIPVSSTTVLDGAASHSWPQTSRILMPHPPDFELKSDGIYRFRYTTASSLQSPLLKSSQIYSEEFGVTTYEDDGDNDNSLPVPPTTETNLETIPPTIDGSEDAFPPTESPINYRDYFRREEEKPKKFEVSRPTVTVTITEHSNASRIQTETDSREVVHQEILENPKVMSTPQLPIKPTLLADKVDSTREQAVQILPTHVSKTLESQHTGDEPKLDEAFVLSSSLSPLQEPITSRDFHSIYYSTNQGPNFSSSTYVYASSTEYSFADDGSGNFDGFENHHNAYQPEPPHNVDVHHHHHHHGHRPHHGNKHFIQPTPTYWDTLGLKTPQVNQSLHDVIEPLLIPVRGDISTPSSVPVTAVSGNVPKPEPPVPDPLPPPATPSTEEGDKTTEQPHSESAEVTLPPTTPHSEQEMEVTFPATTEPPHIPQDVDIIPESVTESRNPESGSTEDTINHLPTVAAYVQISLDMSATQFCPNIKSFKELIMTIYSKNNEEISMDQIVIYSEPNCIEVTHAQPHSSKSSSNNRKTPNSSPATSSARVSTGSGKELEPEKEKSRKDGGHLIPSREVNDLSIEDHIVYIYITNPNGTYDLILTKSFPGYWNLSQLQNESLFRKIKRVEMIIRSDGLIEDEKPTNENSSILAIISVASVAAICFLILAIFLLVMRHRQAQNNFAKRCTPVTLDDYSLDNISVFNSFRRKQRLRASKRSYTNGGFDDPNAPTRVLDAEGLGIAVKELNQIYDEFARIPNVNPTLDDVPNGAESKNRYANVIPMPDSRVVLTFQDEQPNSDYINANYVQGANGVPKSFIITQGPLEETVNDFWRMIWEQQVRVIFMVTDFAEGGIPKCAEYYPRSETIDCTQVHGDFQVTLEKREIAEHWITSFLVVKDLNKNIRRDVIHLWYHSWPEKGIPDSPKSTLDFLVKSRKYTKESCPVVVHCSPGTGRSGTLVACEIGLREFETSSKVDIPQLVKRIRHNRAGAVQTKEQYRHIFDVLHLYGMKFMTTPPPLQSTIKESKEI